MKRGVISEGDKKMKVKKWHIIIAIMLVVVSVIVSVLVMETKARESMHRVKLANGDEITFEYGTFNEALSQTFDKRFVLIPAGEAEERFVSFAAVSLSDSGGGDYI